MDILVIELYTKQRLSLRAIAKKVDSNHHRIKRILIRNGIKLNHSNRKRPEFSKERRENMSRAMAGRASPMKGKKQKRTTLYKNMQTHLKYNISFEWLSCFEDIEKLKFLNRAISRKRDNVGFTSDTYIAYIEKFYHDGRFNTIYNKWFIKKCKWLKPSLDHIKPKSQGGKINDINNMQFVTWLENRAKIDMSQEEWDNIKENIHEYFS